MFIYLQHKYFILRLKRCFHQTNLSISILVKVHASFGKMGLFKLEKMGEKKKKKTRVGKRKLFSINYVNDLSLILNARKTFQTSLNLEFIYKTWHPHNKEYTTRRSTRNTLKHDI